VNADLLGVPRLRTLRTIGARGIKTWRAFGAPILIFDNACWLGHALCSLIEIIDN